MAEYKLVHMVLHWDGLFFSIQGLMERICTHWFGGIQVVLECLVWRKFCLSLLKG